MSNPNNHAPSPFCLPSFLQRDHYVTHYSWNSRWISKLGRLGKRCALTLHKLHNVPESQTSQQAMENGGNRYSCGASIFRNNCLLVIMDYFAKRTVVMLILFWNIPDVIPFENIEIVTMAYHPQGDRIVKYFNWTSLQLHTYFIPIYNRRGLETIFASFIDQQYMDNDQKFSNLHLLLYCF